MSVLLHELLVDTAKTYPERTAVIYKDTQINYAELNTLSFQLALCCMRKGVEAGGRVGIYIDKSIDAVVALFGILRSGASYVPLDPVAPVERQVLIIDDCSLEYLITSSKKFPQIKQILKRTDTLKYIIVLDCTEHAIKEEFAGQKWVFKNEIFGPSVIDMKQPLQTITDKNLAYILYTSGSTGQPKGVMISHKASMAFVLWAWKTFQITHEDIVSAHAPFHFDLSILDIFVSVKAGAAICLVPQGISSFPKSLADFIEQQRISSWYSVPSILTQLVLHGGLDKRNFSFLKQILFAGEVFPTKYFRQLMELIPHVKYFNLYGPTETNVITYCQVTQLPKTDRSIPIGKLCDGVKAYIVNEENIPVKSGEKGELLVSCPTLMEGYWNDPEKSGKVLLKNFLEPSSGEMIYKTGDLVKFNEDENLDYHGRCDAMIKSRGYRIELGEIETALSNHPDIDEAAVVAIPDEEIGKRIRAAISLKNDSTVSVQDVKLFCAKKLPHYMIPEVISIFEVLPRTSTGKMDRKKIEKECSN